MKWFLEALTFMGILKRAPAAEPEPSVAFLAEQLGITRDRNRKTWLQVAIRQAKLRKRKFSHFQTELEEITARQIKREQAGLDRWANAA